MTKVQKRALKELLTEALGGAGRITLQDAVVKMRNVRGFFTDEGYAKAQQAYEERLTASVLRELEEGGAPVYANVQRTDDEGNVTHEYVQLPLLDLEEFRQAADYRVKMALRHIKVLQVLAKECETVHSQRLPVQLSLLEQELRKLRPAARAQQLAPKSAPNKQRKPRAER